MKKVPKVPGVPKVNAKLMVACQGLKVGFIIKITQKTE